MATVTFRALETRPPTPPKGAGTSTDHAKRFLEDDYELDIGNQKNKSKLPHNVNLDTPPQSSPQQSNSESSKQSRKVSFLPQPLADSGIFGLRLVLPSKGLKSSKSILKPHDSSPSCDSTLDPFFSPDKLQTFRKMIESTLQMLEGEDIVSRQDAYRMLNNGLRAYDMESDLKALRSTIPRLEEFLRRDIIPVDGRQSTKDLSLPALKLVITLIHLKNNLAGGFKAGFIPFLVDQSISLLKQQNPRKDLAIHFMQLLSSRPIHKRSVTVERITDLLVILYDVHDRVSGKNVNCLRLMIYQSLARFSPASLAEKPSLWLPHILHGMLAENSDLRDRAIETALTTGVALGNNRAVAQTAFGMLNQEGSLGATYLIHFERSLVKSMEDTETARHVPQIWGALMLLLRGEKDMLETWFCSSSWLKIVEECFNASDSSLNLEALLAWNRTIFAVGSSISCKARIMQKLRTPITGHLQRPKLAPKVRAGALSTLCALIYYAFRPGISQESVGLCWKIFIHDTFTKVLEKPTGSAPDLARMLSAMLYSSTVRVWNVDRALGTAVSPFRIDEVPRLDAQWVRRNVVSVSKVVFVLLRTLWLSPRSGENDAQVLWTSFLRAIAEAGNKEIKLTMESKKALAEITNMLHRLWETTPMDLTKNSHPQTQFITTFLSFVQNAIDILGPMHFANNILTRTNNGAFEAAATPTRHTPPRPGLFQSPILAIVKLIARAPVSEDDGNILDIRLKAVLKPCWEARGSRTLKVTFAKECSAMLSVQSTDHTATLGADIWCCVASLTAVCLDEEFSSTSGESHSRLSHEFADINFILQRGLLFNGPATLIIASTLIQSFSKRAKAAAGDAGVVLVVTEPLAKHLDLSIGAHNWSLASSYVASILGDGVSLPSQRTLEHARKALWDHPPSTHDPTGLGWLKSLYSSVNKCMKFSYSKFDENNISTTEKLLSTLATFLRGPSNQSRNTIPGSELFLWNASEGICQWIEDKHQKVFETKTPAISVRLAVEKLWNNVLEMISRFPLKSSAQLKIVEAFFCSGFQSRSKGIANSTISSWNISFGAEEKLEYSPRLRHLLARLHTLVDINLRTLPSHLTDKNLSESTFEGVLDMENVEFPWLDLAQESQFEMKETARISRIPSSLARPRSSLLMRGTPEPTPMGRKAMRASSKLTPPPRFRHDDSQIQYVAVDLSPAGSVEIESQMLTENQKDVRSRQRDELNLFKDIRSSSPSSSVISGGLQSARAINTLSTRRQQPPEIDGHSPVQEAGDVSDVGDMIDSSPLSRSQRGSSLTFTRTPVRAMSQYRPDLADYEEEEDIPSSPPEMNEETYMDEGDAILNPKNRAISKLGDEPSTAIAVSPTKILATEDESGGAEAPKNMPDATDLPVTALDTGVPLKNLLPSRDERGLTIAGDPDAKRDESAHQTDMVNRRASSVVANTPPSEIDDPGPVAERTNDARTAVKQTGDKSTEESQMRDVEPSTQDKTTGINGLHIVTERKDQTDSSPPAPRSVSVVADSFALPNPDASQLSQGTTDRVGSQHSDSSLQDAKSTLANARRMIATHVLIPSPREKHEYEDFSQVQDSTVISDTEDPANSTSKKRKSTSPTTSFKKQKIMSDENEERIITIRPRGVNSPSLRSLVMSSDLLVKKTPQPRSPAGSSQKSVASQSQRRKSRKRSPVVIEDDETVNKVLEEMTPTEGSVRAIKRQKLSPESQLSVASQIRHSPHRRSSRLSGDSAALLDALTPKSRSRRAALAKSPLTSANISSQNDEYQSPRGPSTSTPEVEATTNVVVMKGLVDVEMNDVASSARFLDSSFDTPISSLPDGAITQTQVSQPAKGIEGNGERLSENIEKAPIPQHSPWNDTTVDITTNLQVTPRSYTIQEEETQFTLPQVQASPTVISNPTTPTLPFVQHQSTTPPTPPSLARSIMGRLRDILVDCTKLVLGSGNGGTGGEAEYEEMQDLAHELQGEILRARRRGRAG